jgi:DNA invertase Pin-like site-specific DNA recombinase
MAITSESAGARRRPLGTAQTPPGENSRQIPDRPRQDSAGSPIGYARVSRPDQVLDRQIDALREVGCARVFEDQGVSGIRAQRPGLDACLGYLRHGDTLVVQSLDRLGRRTSELLRLVETLAERGVSLRILNLGIDTGTPAGQLVLTIMAALAQMEREVLAERTRDGLAAARARGRVGGRRPSLTEEQVGLARQLHRDGESAMSIARLLRVSDRTVRRVVSPDLR